MFIALNGVSGIGLHASPTEAFFFVTRENMGFMVCLCTLLLLSSCTRHNIMESHVVSMSVGSEKLLQDPALSSVIRGLSYYIRPTRSPLRSQYETNEESHIPTPHPNVVGTPVPFDY